MPSSHALAVQLAERAAQALGNLFAHVGGVEQPQGAIWRAYRVGRQVLGRSFTSSQLQDVLNTIYATVQDTTRQLVRAAAQQGAQQAQQQLQIYGVGAYAIDVFDVEQQAMEAVLGSVAQAHRQTLLTYAATNDPALIIGDATRVGLLGPALAAALLTRWLVASHQTAFLKGARQIGGRGYKRQAVATLSARTTTCCLQVHGQIVGLDESFTLSGTPHYASQMRQPPFHHYCRTVVALVPTDDGEDDVTATMRAGAAAELTARARGTTTQRHRSGTALEP